MSSRAVRRVTIVPGEQTQIWGPADSIQAAITLSLGLRSGDVVMCRVACLIMHDYASYEWLTKIFAEGAKPVPITDWYTNPCVCKIDLTDVASMAWTATAARGLQGARDARVAGFAQRSHRHRLPPRTDDSIFDGKRTEGSRNRGTHPAPRLTGSAKPAHQRCPQHAREHRACPRSLERCPQAQTQSLERGDARKLPHRLPKCRRRGAATRWTARRPHP